MVEKNEKEMENLVERTKFYFESFFNEDFKDIEKLERTVSEEKQNLQEDMEKWNLKNKQKIINKLMDELTASRATLETMSIIYRNIKKTIEGAPAPT